MTALIEYLFPKLAEIRSTVGVHPDALSESRPLLTTLRLGLLPGHNKRADIEALCSADSPEVASILAMAYAADTLELVIARLHDIYPTIGGINHVRLWKGIAAFLKKPDCEWMSSYQPMHLASRQFAEVLERAVARDQVSFAPVAVKVFTNLRNTDEDVLTAIWLRTYIIAFGLFGWRREGSSSRIFLTEEQVQAIAPDMSASMRSLHLTDRLLPCRWDLQPVYTMMDTGQWDDPRRLGVDRVLEDGKAVDAISLMLFGSYYTTERSTIAKFCSVDKYLSAVRERLAVRKAMHESVVLAHEKALQVAMSDRADEDGDIGPEDPKGEGRS